jgi:hypothetical protein
LLRIARNDRHCEERSDEAIQKVNIAKEGFFLLILTENAGFSPAFIYERRVAPFV